MSVDQSIQHLATLRSYGGADSTAPSFIRPQYVRYNSIAKAQDLGAIASLDAIVSGTVGAEAGAPTLFFRVETLARARIGIAKASINRFVDATISIGVVDEKLDPLPVGDSGFVEPAETYGNPPGTSGLLPPGIYYFTITSSRWQIQPFEVFITVISNRELEGDTTGSLILEGRLALVKLDGAAGGLLDATAAAPTGSALDLLVGSAGGILEISSGLAILGGTAGGTLILSGSFGTRWEIEGSAGGTAPVNADLTVFTPY